MPKFSKGDRVSWNSEAGQVSGWISKVHEQDFKFKGHTHRAWLLHPLTIGTKTRRFGLVNLKVIFTSKGVLFMSDQEQSANKDETSKNDASSKAESNSADRVIAGEGVQEVFEEKPDETEGADDPKK